MKRASITEAKNRLSALIDHARQGDTVIIEDRGVPVAQLSPISSARAGADKDRIARLERAGILRPPMSRAPGKIFETPPPGPKLPVSLSRIVIQEREEGW